MFQIRISNVPVLFSKFFSTADREAVLSAIPQGTRRVVFIDTPATAELAPTIEVLLGQGIEVNVRDHHDEPNPANPRAKQIADAAMRIRELCGSNAVISNRKANPACSSLIEVGQFAGEGTVSVADSDPDGLTAAMKAAGVFYVELDADADVLDGGRVGQTADKLSANAYLFVRAMSTLPTFDATRPQVSEDAKAKLFNDFVLVVNGDSDARARLEKGVETYEAGVKEAERLASTVTDLMASVAFVDLMKSPRFDLTTLAGKMDARTGTKVTVQKKAVGPIAAKCGGVQYSLAVVKAEQANINLQELLPSGFVSSPETGIISNTSFLLHVSQEVWESQVLPALRVRFGN
jgi:hypothetical protein